MIYKKITYGYVVQSFNDVGQCIKQEFITNDSDCEYEDDDGNLINMVNMPFGGNEYHPFDMSPPEVGDSMGVGHTLDQGGQKGENNE